MNDKIKNKMKKQRKSITVKITSILLAVWLIVSAVFCVIALNAEKQEQITKSHNDYVRLVESIASFSGMSYNEMCKYVQIAKEHYVDIVRGEIKEEEINRGADTGNYDKDLHITLYRCAFSGETEEDMQDQLIMDTDKEIYLSFVEENYIEYDGESGILNYDEFVSSMSQEDLETICEYLNKEKDKDGYLYILVNKECYYNPENGHVYPKTVEIAKVYEDSFGYAVAETIETFELNPKNTEGLTLYNMPQNEPKIIDGEFILNNFSSGGLIQDPFEKLSLELYDPDAGIIEKDGLFTFTINEGGQYLVQTLGFDGSEYAIAYRTAVDESLEQAVVIGEDEEYGTVYDAPEPDVQYLSYNIGLRYAKQVNLLQCCSDTLIIGILGALIFFMIIGFIIIVMMCKVMKTQLIQEQKRNDITNALAHDIKTPLFIISGYAQNLKENVNMDKREHYCDRIIERTDDVNALVHKMLEFSKLESLDKAIDLTEVNLCEIIEKVTDSFGSLKDGKRFLVKCDAPCIISADYQLMHRVISNLVDNAVRYSDSDSNINIAININEFIISNKCSNITQEDIKHLTEPYYMVKENREGKGNGLGLSIVKTILDLHNYKLDITLKDGIISFKITLNN